jgi:hypothetical protein
MSVQFFISGNYSGEANAVIEYIANTQSSLLTSFAYPAILRSRTASLASMLRTQGHRCNHMLDSGAFTAWSSGKEIDIEALITTSNKLLDRYSDCMDFTFVSLDCIPGSRGAVTTEEERAGACKVSARNYELMRKRIPAYVKPVFHTGDPDWLIDVYKDAQYVGFGMNQNLSEGERVSWAMQAAKKFPGKKLHGLAATGSKMIRAVAWHSVDSAAWQYAASMGAINWMRSDGSLISISVSVESPRRKDMNAHFDTLPKMAQDVLRAAVEAEGFTMENLAANYYDRWVWNVMMYQKLCDNATPVDFQQEGLFDA